MIRSHLLSSLADRVSDVRTRPARVGIDGIDAAGKTTLADELAVALKARGGSVIRCSIEGFHNPKAVRYRRGPLSPHGYYLDSFDYQSLLSELLLPLGPGGNREYRSAVYDFRKDQPVDTKIITAPRDAVLLFDGVFLQRPELRDVWDLTIFLKASFETTLARACARDISLFGTVAEIRSRYEGKYYPGQKIYFESCRPDENADIVVHNDVPENASLEIPSGSRCRAPGQ